MKKVKMGKVKIKQEEIFGKRELEDQSNNSGIRGKKAKQTSTVSHILLQPKNDVIEYLRGINVVSCGGNGRKWTKFVSRKLRRALCSV